MEKRTAWPARWSRPIGLTGCLVLLAALNPPAGKADKSPAVDLAAEFGNHVRPLLKQYCLKCHSQAKKKGDLDLERFTSFAEVRKDPRAWQNVLDMLEAGEMPPKEKAQPRPQDRQKLVTWVRKLLDLEARSQAGDPGRVIVRRLSNAEYNHTVRDLTGVDLRPARDFPVDGAAGEGFTNAGDALVMSPTLLGKYLDAAKEIAAHAVLLPDGFRFSRAKTRRDWTDEALAELRQFYAQYSADGQLASPVKVYYSPSEFYLQRFWDGKLPLRPYLTASIRYRAAIAGGQTTLETVANREHLNPKYFRILWSALSEPKASFPLDRLRSRWQKAKPADVDGLLANIADWQRQLWRFVPIGSYRYGNTIRQRPNNPPLVKAQTLALPLKPAPGQDEVVLYLAAKKGDRHLFPPERGLVVWQRPRFEGGGKPALLLRDYADYGGQFELDCRSLFAATAKYLKAAMQAANDRKLTPDDLARKYQVDGVMLRRWMDLLALGPRGTGKGVQWMPAVPLQLLDAPLPKANQKRGIDGWVASGADLPVLITNGSDQVQYVPGTMRPHRVAVHPTPTQFVAAAWISPMDGTVRIQAEIVHAHPACGNGIAWWLEHRRSRQAAVLAEGNVDRGKQAKAAPGELKIHKGDLVCLAIDPRDGNHVCDLTEITLTITEVDKPGRVWDLARDVADTIRAGNPHADRLGNRDVWRFVRGPITKSGRTTIAPGSSLARWRSAASDPKRQTELANLAQQVQSLLAGTRPTQEKHPDRLLYDALVSLDGPLLRGIDLGRLSKGGRAASGRYGLAKARFGRHSQGKPAEAASLVVLAGSVLQVRVPAALFRDRQFVVDAKLEAGGPDQVAQFQVLTSPPRPDAPLDTKIPCLASSDKAARQLLRGLDDFRRVFPSFICYGRVIPDDEVVCLKLFHREDEPLCRLFLGDGEKQHLDRLWAQLRFISQFPVTENKQLPQFIGFVTQDQPKELLAYFESQRGPFRRRAEQFEKDLEAAVPRQLENLLAFAANAYRRPLQARERIEIHRLYAGLRKKHVAHEEAFRSVLTRVLISPSFLFRIEQAPPGKEARPVSDWGLATRLSYFLWATMPDAELRQAAAAGRLHEPRVLAAQVARMLKDPRVRGLAVEFGTQWLHVRQFRESREKNEKLFPMFNDKLRAALFEESVLFLQHLFQDDRPLSDILDADYTFLNEALARHYGISGVTGLAWRRVSDVKKYGRGGVLALGTVLTTQSGASRTSPVLRGNWLVETMLGEKLPKPPPNVPRLPEEETGASGLTVRQMVEKHAKVAQCAVCHQRIDPFGFALEKYDPIGRFRDKDLGGKPVDVKVRLKDGTRFEGIEGLRAYLLAKRRVEFERHFCQKLLGYALGRSVTLSDQTLIEEMRAGLKKNDGRLSALVLAIVQSKQFRYHRGLEATQEE